MHSMFIDGENNTLFMELPNATCVSRDLLKASFLSGKNFVDLMFNFSARLNAFELTSSELSLFSGLMLLTPGQYVWNHGLSQITHSVLSQL